MLCPGSPTGWAGVTVKPLKKFEATGGMTGVTLPFVIFGTFRN
jgi:hypothetical protein